MADYPILITGCNRGLGLEMVRSYLNDRRSVIATCRNLEKADELNALKAAYPETLELFSLNVTNELQRLALCESLNDRPLDMIISNAGVYGGDQQDFGDVDELTWLEALNVNTIAPFMITQLLMHNLLQGNQKTIAMLSSKMGSIDDNGFGQCYIYRSSKTALNSVIKSLSIDLKDQGVRVLALHPGWVRTDMGGAEGLIDVEESVTGLRKIMDRNNSADSGRFFAYDGAEIAW